MSLDAYILTADEQTREILRQNNRRIIVIRWLYVSLLAVVGIGSILLTGVERMNLNFYLAVIGTLVVLNGAFWLLARPQRQALLYYKVLAQTQLLLDIGLATASVYIQGGPNSQTIILYTIPIILSSVILPSFFAYTTALLSGIAFIGASLVYILRHPIILNTNHVLSVIIFYPVFFVLLASIIVNLSRYAAIKARRQSYDELLSMLTHQLRHPISAMAAILDVFQNAKDFKKLSPTQRNYVSMIEKENKRLNSLITNLLEAGRIDPSQITAPNFKVVDLGALIMESAKSCAISISRMSDLRFRFPDHPVYTPGDAPQLRMAFDNLINNAFLYSFVGSRVTIRLEAKGNKAMVNILDEGKGVSVDQQKKLREIFEQTHESNFKSTTTPKAGLGLYVSKRIIERHGGKFNLISEANAGTTIAITLKRSTSDA